MRTLHGGQAALGEDRLVVAARFGMKFCMCGRKLDDVIREQIGAFRGSLGDDRQTGLTLCLEQQRDPRPPDPGTVREVRA